MSILSTIAHFNNSLLVQGYNDLLIRIKDKHLVTFDTKLKDYTMNKIRTHYDNLKIDRSATFEEIKVAYRKLIQIYHPDKNRSSDAESISRIIITAYTVLSNPITRKEHDDWIDSYHQNNMHDAHFSKSQQEKEEYFRWQQEKEEYFRWKKEKSEKESISKKNELPEPIVYVLVIIFIMVFMGIIALIFK